MPPTATLQRAADAAPNHPALRWKARWSGASHRQHRRDGNTLACGAPALGGLTLADATANHCPVCFPRQR